MSPIAAAAKEFQEKEAARKAKEKQDEANFKFREPEAKTIGAGEEAKELKRLTPEEKAARRLKMNLIMATICLLILAGVLFLLGT